MLCRSIFEMAFLRRIFALLTAVILITNVVKSLPVREANNNENNDLARHGAILLRNSDNLERQLGDPNRNSDDKDRQSLLLSASDNIARQGQGGVFRNSAHGARRGNIIYENLARQMITPPFSR